MSFRYTAAKLQLCEAARRAAISDSSVQPLADNLTWRAATVQEEARVFAAQAVGDDMSAVTPATN